MAVAEVGTRTTFSNDADGPDTTRTFSHTVPVDADFVVISTHGFSSGSGALNTTCTLNAVSMTKATGVASFDTETNLWYMKASALPALPWTGNIVVTHDSSGEIGAVCMNYRGVEQTTSPRNSGSTEAASTTVTGSSLTTVAGDLLVGAAEYFDGTVVPTGTTVEVVEIDNGAGNNTFIFMHEPATGTSHALGGTLSGDLSLGAYYWISSAVLAPASAKSLTTTIPLTSKVGGGLVN